MVNDQAVVVLFKELTSCLTGMIFSTILDQEDGSGELSQQAQEKGMITIAVEAICEALVKQSSAEELDDAEPFVAFARAGCFDQRLLAGRCPGVGQGTPPGETGLLRKEDRCPDFPGLDQDFRPLFLHPMSAGFFFQVIGDKASLLVRKAHAM